MEENNNNNNINMNTMSENAVSNTETQEQAEQPSESMKVRVLRITAIKGYLNKSVDLLVDEDGMKWLRRIFAMDKSTINVEGNGKNTLKVRFSLLQRTEPQEHGAAAVQRPTVHGERRTED